MTLHLKNKRFGKLTAVEPIEKRYGNKIVWRCVCDCGGERLAVGTKLHQGEVIACRSCTNRHSRDKLSRTAEYRTWNSMITRCTNSKHKSYHSYGALGITVCERWRDFRNFLEDMGKRPAGHTLERVDNLLGYTPKNCVWATPVVQQNNRRSNVYIRIGNCTMTVQQWSRESGVSHYTIRQRLKHGWSLLDAVFTKPRGERLCGTF